MNDLDKQTKQTNKKACNNTKGCTLEVTCYFLSGCNLLNVTEIGKVDFLIIFETQYLGWIAIVSDEICGNSCALSGEQSDRLS